MAEFDGSSIQCVHPHLLVWRAMGTDNCQIAKRACQPVHFVHIHQFQVEHCHSCFVACQQCMQLHYVVCHGYPCKIRMKVIRKSQSNTGIVLCYDNSA